MAVPRMDILSENVGRYKMVFRLFSFSACNPAKTEVSYDTTEGGIGLEKDSALYQLMDTRMHSAMNGIVSSDGEYQAILRKSDVYSGEQSGICSQWKLFFIHKIPICLHTVLVICHRLFLEQQLHVANLLLEHIHEIRPVI